MPKFSDYCLWLDDCRPKPTPSVNEWVVAKDIDAFKRIVRERGVPGYVSFDHDLNETHYLFDYTDKKTGLDCIIWFIDYVKEVKADPPRWGVHTMNVHRINDMRELLEKAWPNRNMPYPGIG